jgi:hypothetical protein
VELGSTHLLMLLDVRPDVRQEWFYLPIAYLIPLAQCACLCLFYYTQASAAL